MRLFKRGKLWYVDARQQGMGRVSTGCTEESKAHEFAQRMLRGIGNGQTLSDALDRAWSKHYAGMRCARNVEAQIKVLKELAGKTKLTDIDTPMLDQMRDRLEAERSLSGSTLNRYMAVLSKTLKLANRWGWMSNMPLVPTSKEGEHRVRFLTEAEELQVLAYFNDHCEWMLNLTAFLLDTGARLGEALRITERDREQALRTGKWTIWETKSGKARTVPLTQRAILALREWGWEGRKDRWAEKQWRRMRESLGLADDKEFVIHALRHTCATRLCNQTSDIYAVMHWLGHATVATTRRYAHLNTENLDALKVCLERE